MTEQQLHDGFDRLEGALAPPADALARVEGRVRTRRRRRRTAIGGVAALALVAGGGAIALGLGGDEGSGGTPVATEAPAPGPSTLVLTRPDGSTYAFDDVTVSCQPPAVSGEDTGPTTGRIYAYSPIDVTGPADSDETTVNAPFVYFEGRVAKLGEDQTFTLPFDDARSSDHRAFVLFVADPDVAPSQERANEVSSAESGAAGTVRVLRASCDPTPVLELEVDATLGSEVQQGTLAISGALD